MKIEAAFANTFLWLLFTFWKEKKSIQDSMILINQAVVEILGIVNGD